MQLQKSSAPSPSKPPEICWDLLCLCYALFLWYLNVLFYHCRQSQLIMALGILLWDPVELGHWTFSFAVRSCVFWIYKSRKVVRSGDLGLFPLSWHPGDPRSRFLFCGGMLEILDPIFLFSVGSWGSRGYWILVFSCGLKLPFRRTYCTESVNIGKLQLI